MENSGEIRGTVTLQNGETLPGVTITVQNNTSDKNRLAVTRANGSYLINYLAVGQYSLKAVLTGLNTVEFKDIMVSANKPTRVNIIMESSSGVH
ncbi:carboxypeptidase-like regulatory domain-containing protein [Kordia sp.]|uniref:carboxypeptidase-like regulatory domain-containing protein n=1 Tax=Kordia sp. TaxID=1965332 RepID=UPI003D2A6DA4